MGKKDKFGLMKVVNAILLAGPRKIYTDGNSTYKSLIPEKIHRVSKYMLVHIERKHLSLRNALKRLNRYTLGFSRNIKMLEACVKLVLWE